MERLCLGNGGDEARALLEERLERQVVTFTVTFTVTLPLLDEQLEPRVATYGDSLHQIRVQPPFTYGRIRHQIPLQPMLHAAPASATYGSSLHLNSVPASTA